MKAGEEWVVNDARGFVPLWNRERKHDFGLKNGTVVTIEAIGSYVYVKTPQHGLCGLHPNQLTPRHRHVCRCPPNNFYYGGTGCTCGGR